MADSLSPALLRAVREAFPERQRRAAACALLEAAAAHASLRQTSVDNREAVLAAAVSLSAGSLRRLGSELAVARTDWRDVLAGQVYVRLVEDLVDELRRAGVAVGRVRRAALAALAQTPGLPFTEPELAARLGGRASARTVDEIVALLLRRRWLRRAPMPSGAPGLILSTRRRRR